MNTNYAVVRTDLLGLSVYLKRKSELLKRAENPDLKGNILVIDANNGNLRLLERILAVGEYEVRLAGSRKVALEAIIHKLPDLLLMASSMPDMEVFEFCRRLKGNPSTTSLPVIFLGEQDKTEDKLKGFEAGGVDYITRPFAHEELLARVGVHCGLHATHKEMLTTNAELSREIDASRLIEEASIESSYRLFQIMQMISVPTFVIDMNHSITHWNNAMERLTKLSAVEMIGTREQWRRFFPSKSYTLADFIVINGGEKTAVDMLDNNYRRSSLIDGAFEGECFSPTFDVSGKWFYITAAPMVDSFGRIIGAIETVQDITERKKAEKELKESEQRYMELSITDSLTKLHNSRHFFRQLSYEIKRARRYKKPLSLMLMDIDNFKRYNDTYGHPEGDVVLKVLAANLKNNLRDSDSAYRYGGEEFTVILPETIGDDALQIGERLRSNFENEGLHPCPETEVHMTVSIGVGSYIQNESAEDFLKRVDEGMYAAKKGGKNQVFLAPTTELLSSVVPKTKTKRVKTPRPGSRNISSVNVRLSDNSVEV